MSRLTGDGTAEPVSRDQILRRELGQGNQSSSYSADPEQRLQPHPADLYSAKSAEHDMYIHIIYHAYFIPILFGETRGAH